MKYSFLLIVSILAIGRVQAQGPVITNIDPLRTYPLDTLLIAGSGFSSTSSSLQVWFDHVKGTIVSSSGFSIRVAVPAQAMYQNVEVINLASRLSVKSPLKFLPSFSGTTFDAAKFQSQEIATNAPSVFDLCSCDFDGDGKPDLAGSRNDGGTDLIVLHNKSTVGAISYDKYDKSNIAALNINQATQHIACGDLNGDGKPDVVASRGGTTANSIFIFLNTSAATPNFSNAVELFLDNSHLARQISINDVNGDGKPEIIVANSASGSVLYVFQNQSTGGVLSINPTPIKVPVAGAPNTLALEVQDFDNDGKPDIITTQNQGANLFFLKNLSTSTISFAAAQTISVAGTLNDVEAADFNNDGKLDLVTTSVFGSQTVVLLNKSNNGTVAFSAANEQTILNTGTGPFGVEVADINGDGFPDIIVNNRQTTSINVFLHNGNFNTPGFTSSTIQTLPKTGWFSRVADFDGDAKPDIVFTNAVGIGAPNTITMLRNTNCHKPVILNTAPLSICPGQTIRLKAIPLPNVTYEWRKNGVVFKAASAEAFADITVADSYTVTAMGESGSCLIVSNAIVVASGSGSIPTDAVINPVAQACVGNDLTLTANVVAGATYIWNGPGGFTSEGSTNQLIITNVTAQQAGIYSVRLKVGDCTGQEDTEEVRVVDVGSFSIGSSATGPVCEGENVTLSVGSSAGRTLQWVKDGADIGGQTNASLILNNIAVAAAGSYKVRVSFDGCTEETGSLSVVVRTKPVANFNVTASACIGEEITFTNTSTIDNQVTVTYGWNFGDGTTSTTQSPAHTYVTAPAQNPSLTVEYTGLNGCSSTASKPITISTPVQPVIMASAEKICPEQTVALSVEDIFNAVEWFQQGVSIGTGPSIDVLQPSDYSVTTEDANGCAGSADITISLNEDCTPEEIVVPNMFSPNGDGKNDRWLIAGVENSSECTMKVFDERGMTVLEKKGYDPTGWDGTYNSKVVPNGVYYYVFVCPNRKPVSGSVLIIK